MSSLKLKLILFGAIVTTSSALYLRMEQKTSTHDADVEKTSTHDDQDAKSQNDYEILAWDQIRQQIEIAEQRFALADMSRSVAELNRDTGVGAYNPDKCWKQIRNIFGH